jgi:hypothetical protein
MPTALIVPQTPNPPGMIAEALEAGLRKHGWRTIRLDPNSAIHDSTDPDLVAGWGWGPIMQAAWRRWPGRVLHVDLPFWGRQPAATKGGYYKLALGGRWSKVTGLDYPADRLARLDVRAAPARDPGPRILICGMSAKAAKDWGYAANEWEAKAIAELGDHAGRLTYRPKPTWIDARPLGGAQYDAPGARRPIATALAEADGVASHHSNTAVDALAAGLPIFVELGPAKRFSVSKLRDLPGAEPPSWADRERFLREMAWHQWTLPEIAAGVWLEPPAPLAEGFRSS